MRPNLDPRQFLDIKNDTAAAMRFFVLLAMTAPSSHNSQPWLFKIKENTLEVRGNPARALPKSDTNHRQLFTSIGCAIENILVAADYYGLPVVINYFPEQAEPFLVARIRFDRLVIQKTSSDNAHPVFKIAERHNNRNPFEARPIPNEFLSALRGMGTSELTVDVVTDEAERQAAARVVEDATEAAFLDKGFTSELSHWIRPSLHRYRDGMPGYNLGIPWLLSFIVPLAIRHGNVAKTQRKMVEEMLRSAPAFVVLSTMGDDPRDWVVAGQTLERIWLMATAAGLNVGVLAAPIQIGDFYLKLQDVLKNPHHPQVFFRLGYAGKIPETSPRLLMNEVLES